MVDRYGKGGLNKKFSDKCNLIIIEHQNGEFSGYAHLKRYAPVREGQRVKAGQIIGYSGLSGYTGYPHLHFQIMIKDTKKSRDAWITIPAQLKVGHHVNIYVSPKK